MKEETNLRDDLAVICEEGATFFWKNNQWGSIFPLVATRTQGYLQVSDTLGIGLKNTHMRIHKAGIYHLHNRGINKQPIFFCPDNYHYFLRKCHKYIKPHCDILAWSLLINEFDLLVNISEKSLYEIKIGNIKIPAISNGIRILESSYAKGINKRIHRTGNLFQQKTKSHLAVDDGYALNIFNYIHQSPVMANLAKSPSEWKYSSFQDYSGIRNGSLCNKQLCAELLGIEIDILRPLPRILVIDDR